ncbi:MAG: hypothetical protein KGH59_01400 [Candidatus Micrarchaeota archaeon]|nr:hypothetical protein [Candidatus Micrarchaeota archaeon]MDE1804422.1 hypothetical protein [Candidatus Micrarchaeota archaeon]
MKIIILDTSSILFGLSNKTDAIQSVAENFPEYSVEVPSGVVRELTKISGGKKKESRQAKVALALIKSHGVKVVRSSGYVDSWILDNAAKSKAIVCTNDIGLKRELKARGIMSVSLAISGAVR